MIAPISYVFGIPADKLSTEYSLEEIVPMLKAANDFMRVISFIQPAPTQQPKKPEYNEFLGRFGQYKKVNYA